MSKVAADSVRTNVKRVFRSHWNNQGFVEVRVKYPPRITDSSQYVSMEKMVASFLRGDGQARFVPAYEVPAGADVEKAIDEMPVTRSDGFDLADSNAVIEAGKKAFNELTKAKGKKPDEKVPPGAPAAKPPQPPAEDAGGK